MSASSKSINRVVTAYVDDETNAPVIFRSAVVNKFPAIVNINPCNFYAYNLINPNTVDIWVKFFDNSGVPVVGTDPVAMTIQVPANGSVVLVGDDIQYHVNGILWVAATLNYQDSDNTAIPVNCTVQVTTK